MEGALGQLIDLIRKGGVVMYPLIILSVISWVFIVERIVNLRVSQFLPPNLNEVKLLLQKSDIESAHKVLSLNSDVFSRALGLVLEEYLKGNRSHCFHSSPAWSLRDHNRSDKGFLRLRLRSDGGSYEASGGGYR